VAQEATTLGDDLGKAQTLLEETLTAERKAEFCESLQRATALFVFPEISVGGLFFFKSVEGRGFILLPEAYIEPLPARTDADGEPQPAETDTDPQSRKWTFASYEQYSRNGLGLNLGFSRRYCVKAVFRDEMDELLRQNKLKSTDEIREALFDDANIFLTREFGVIVGPVDASLPSTGEAHALNCAGDGLQIDLFAVASPDYDQIRDLGREKATAELQEPKSAQAITEEVNRYCK